MFIQTEATPNPATLKFLPGREVMQSGTADFRDAEGARQASPLAGRLFDVPGVTGVFFGYRFHHRHQRRQGRVAASEAGHPRHDHGALHVRPAGDGAGRQPMRRRSKAASSSTMPIPRSW